MARRVGPVVARIVVLFGWLAGCSELRHEERPAWRAQAERACLARGAVAESAFIHSSPEIDGPGICGMTHPFKVTALSGGSVTFNSTATLDCPMIAALDGWLRDVVQPAAQARFGEPVARINSMGSYSCRGMNNMSGAKLSEHAFGNAVDVGGFVLASGREVNVMRDFNGADEQARAFLHEAHGGACQTFTTVLGPGANVFHYNHIHVDLAMHGSSSRGPRRYCKPVPEQALPEPPPHDALPDPPAIEEEMDMARAPIPEPSYGRSGPALAAALPPSVPANKISTGAPPRPPFRPDASRDADGGRRAPRRSDPPLVTFSYVTPRAPERFAEPAPFRRPPSALPEPGREGPRDEPAVPGEPARAETPPEGGPRDWDITSAVRR